MMEKQSVTIYDVAEQAGVSMATVSRVVNGNPNVKAATRKKVMKVIEDLDYRPNAVARGLASKRTTTVGVILPDINNAFFASLSTGINDIALMYHYDILLATAEGEKDRDVSVFQSMLAKQVDGIIYLGNEISPALRQEIERTNTPVVLAGTQLEDTSCASVNIDHEAAVYDAISYLAEHHEKIALITGPLTEYINGHDLLLGYKKALKDHNRTYSEAYIFESHYTLKAGEQLAERLHNSGVTAAFVADDLLAVGILNGLQDQGYQLPEDMELISANNTIYTDMVRPKISSIQHPLYDIGAVAMRLLTKMMHNEEIEDKNIILPYSLRFKGTTK